MPTETVTDRTMDDFFVQDAIRKVAETITRRPSSQPPIEEDQLRQIKNELATFVRRIVNIALMSSVQAPNFEQKGWRESVSNQISASLAMAGVRTLAEQVIDQILDRFPESVTICNGDPDERETGRYKFGSGLALIMSIAAGTVKMFQWGHDPGLLLRTSDEAVVEARQPDLPV